MAEILLVLWFASGVGALSLFFAGATTEHAANCMAACLKGQDEPKREPVTLGTLVVIVMLGPICLHTLICALQNARMWYRYYLPLYKKLMDQEINHD